MAHEVRLAMQHQNKLDRPLAEKRGWAALLTGLPAAGKSTIAVGVQSCLREEGMRVEVISSADTRALLTHAPTYSEEEKALYYRIMIWGAEVLTRNGTSVLLDATFNTQKFREWARAQFPEMAEIFVQCSLTECRRRDAARGSRSQYTLAVEHGRAHLMPGLSAPFEEPRKPDLVVLTDQEPVEESVAKVLATIKKRFQLA